jgi:exopolyphosphatase/guanosine-5'-triphosphate,3'-diphosphate pyrophosphatase
MNSSSLSAAIDLGSNSFRLTLAQINTTALSTHSNPITLLHTLHETVRLAAGLTPNQLLSQTTIDKALQALMHFRQYLAQTQPKNIYAIATSALRKALNAEAFLQPAEQLLNSPINVISGLEEARLIYSGSLYQRASDQKKRLVIDIGGGSTELIVGQDDEPDLINSIDIGCISHIYQFFPAGDIDTARMSQAEIAAQQAFAHLADSYRVAGWVHTFASSGIACALAKVLTAYQLNSIDTVTPHTPAPYLTRLGLTRLKELVLKSKHINCLQLQGLDIERTPIFIGGLTIMLGIMRAFNIEVIETIGDVLPFGIFKHLHQLETADHNLIHV